MSACVDSFIPVLPEPLLNEHNFFELYPFDGGGCFIHRDLVGSVDDAEITRRIVEEDALADFGGVEAIDFRKFEHWRSIEKSCWINRMYFIVPIARRYAATGDEKLAQLLRRILLGFRKNNPAPATREETVALETRVLYSRDHDYNEKGPDFDGPVEYQWFDFQPASRIIHILHALYFLRGSATFSESDRKEIDELLRVHARCIYWAEAFHNPLAPGNHQALRGLALLYAAAIFKGEPEAADWRRTAEKVCEFHLTADFLADGMLIDLSPSYHFFESWIARDMVRLADREKFDLSAPARARVAKAFDVCRKFRQPDGLSTVINDGYPLDMKVFLQSLPAAKEDSAPETLLPEAGFALWKSEGAYLLFDCSPLKSRFAHFHGGKQAVTFFFGGRPFLTDSGCCNYDDLEFTRWYKQPRAHSSLLVDGKGDSVLEGRYCWLKAPEMELGEWKDGAIASTMTSSAPGWEGVVWSRKVRINAAGMEISDLVSCGRKIETSFVFNLHPDVKAEISGASVLLTNGDVRLRATFDAEPELCDGLGFVHFRKTPTRRLVVRFFDAGIRTKVIFEPATC